MDRLRDILLFVAGIVSIGSLIMAAYEGFNQRLASAWFLAALGVVCTLIVFIPQLEALKAFGIEAKLRQTYTEAVATLASVKRLAEISAKATYLTLAWGNRMGTPPAREKQAVLDEIESQLAELKVSPQQLADIRRPFVSMIRLDFFFLFQGVLREYATILNSKLVDDVHKASDPNAATASVLRHSDLITAWTKWINTDELTASLSHRSLEDVLNELLPKAGQWLNDKELTVFQKFKAEIVRLNADCEKKGGYTTEAVSYYDRYSNDHNVDRANQLRAAVLQQP
jgi:hypothetical protein